MVRKQLNSKVKKYWKNLKKSVYENRPALCKIYVHRWRKWGLPKTQTVAEGTVEDFGASLAEEIKAIEQTLKNTKLNDKALVVLIATDANVKRDDVRAVLRVMRTMKERFLK